MRLGDLGLFEALCGFRLGLLQLLDGLRLRNCERRDNKQRDDAKHDAYRVGPLGCLDPRCLLFSERLRRVCSRGFLFGEPFG